MRPGHSAAFRPPWPNSDPGLVWHEAIYLSTAWRPPTNMAAAQCPFISEAQGPLRLAGAKFHINEGCSQCQLTRSTDRAAVKGISLWFWPYWGCLAHGQHDFLPFPWPLSFLHLSSQLGFFFLRCPLPLHPSSCSVLISFPLPFSLTFTSILCQLPFLHCICFSSLSLFLFSSSFCAFPPLIATKGHCESVLQFSGSFSCCGTLTFLVFF